MESALLHLDANQIDGDIVECGVWQGGHIILARMISRHRVCWLYDTFDGMTKPRRVDGRKANYRYQSKAAAGRKWAAASLADVTANFISEGLFDSDLLRFVVGDVCQTLLDDKNLPDKVALLRLDTDWYESTKIELEVLFPRLAAGGVLIIDDYGHWMGARKAVDEYFGDRTKELKPIDYTAVMTA